MNLLLLLKKKSSILKNSSVLNLKLYYRKYPINLRLEIRDYWKRD